MKEKLWTRNFTLAFVGMIISAAGGVGLNLAMGVLVFQETQSTTLAAVFTALSMAPQFVLPLVMGPVIDRRNPLRMLVGNELLLAGVFFAMAAVTWRYGFSYILYMTFSILISCFGVVSQLASGSVIPQIMKRQNYVRGNAILNVIYPLCSVIVTPVAMLLLERFGMTVILLGYGVSCVLDAALESRIDEKFDFIQSDKSYNFKAYSKDLRDGVGYLRDDTAVRSVFFLFALVMFSDASNTLIYPFFNQSQTLTNNQYALLSSVRSAGYMAGGFLHYFIKIPDNKRFSIAVGVYLLFVVLDGAFFFLPLWAMCASRFVLGVAGMNSANIRVSAIQTRVPNHYRAKVNALYTVMVSATTMLGQLAAGALGEFLPYWSIQVGFNLLYLLGVVAFVLPKKNKVRELYNYESEAPAKAAG